MLYAPKRKLTYVMSTFTDRLNAAFERSGRTRAELAAVLRGPNGKIGVSVQAVGQQLGGKTRSMTAENAARAARLLGVDVYWLCTGEGQVASTGPTSNRPEEALEKWPFDRVGRDQWAQLTERERGAIEEVVAAKLRDLLAERDERIAALEPVRKRRSAA